MNKKTLYVLRNRFFNTYFTLRWSYVCVFETIFQSVKSNFFFVLKSKFKFTFETEEFVKIGIKNTLMLIDNTDSQN